MKTILVVEDNDLIRENICEILELEGYKVFPAENGQVGWNKLKEIGPDLIVSDVNMPIMNGFELLKNIRESNESKHIPFIFLTVRNTMQELRLGMNYGADDYLAKPFNINQLISSVKARLARTMGSDNERQAEKIDIDNARDNLVFEEYVKLPLKKLVSLGTKLSQDSSNSLGFETVKIGKDIRKVSQRLERNINKILTDQKLSVLKQLPGNNKDMRSEITYDVEGVIKKIAKRHQASYDNQLIIDIENVDLPISQELFSIVMDELIQNALKFSNGKRPSKIAAAGISNSEYQIKVYNSGSLFSDSDLSNVGRYKTFNEHKGPKPGMALGLYNAKRAIEMAGGQLGMENSLPNTTIFNIKYPLMGFSK